MAAKRVALKIPPPTKLYLWFPIPVSQLSMRDMNKITSKRILRCRGLLFSLAYLDARTGIPGIAVRRKVWSIASRVERKAMLLHEGYHVLLGHPYRRISSVNAEKEVAALMPPWALHALDTLMTKCKRLVLKTD